MVDSMIPDTHPSGDEHLCPSPVLDLLGLAIISDFLCRTRENITEGLFPDKSFEFFLCHDDTSFFLLTIPECSKRIQIINPEKGKRTNPATDINVLVINVP
jgi:hypothetical protein